MSFDPAKPSGGVRLQRLDRMLYVQDGGIFDWTLRYLGPANWIIRDDMSFDDAYEYVVEHKTGAPGQGLRKYTISVGRPILRPDLVPDLATLPRKKKQKRPPASKARRATVGAKWRVRQLVRQWRRRGLLTVDELVELNRHRELLGLSVNVEVPLIEAQYRASCRAALAAGRRVDGECLWLRQLYLDAIAVKAAATAKANEEVWRALHPSAPATCSAPAKPIVDDEEEEDWRPLFLRPRVLRPGFHKSDEERAEEAGRYLETWLPYWREQFEHWVRLWEEAEEETVWAQADDEKREPPKITAAMLRTFRNRNQVWRR